MPVSVLLSARFSRQYSHAKGRDKPRYAECQQPRVDEKIAHRAASRNGRSSERINGGEPACARGAAGSRNAHKVQDIDDAQDPRDR